MSRSPTSDDYSSDSRVQYEMIGETQPTVEYRLDLKSMESDSSISDYRQRVDYRDVVVVTG